MSQKKLERSNDKMIAGVAAGIAEYLNMDVTLFRILYILISLVSAAFPGILVYLILWIVMPKADKDQNIIENSN